MKDPTQVNDKKNYIGDFIDFFPKNRHYKRILGEKENERNTGEDLASDLGPESTTKMFLLLLLFLLKSIGKSLMEKNPSHTHGNQSSHP